MIRADRHESSIRTSFRKQLHEDQRSRDWKNPHREASKAGDSSLFFFDLLRPPKACGHSPPQKKKGPSFFLPPCSPAIANSSRKRSNRHRARPHEKERIVKAAAKGARIAKGEVNRFERSVVVFGAVVKQAMGGSSN